MVVKKSINKLKNKSWNILNNKEMFAENDEIIIIIPLRSIIEIKTINTYTILKYI